MKVTPLEISDVLLIEPRIFKDDRGYFFESFNQKKFEETTGIKTSWIQDNESKSTYGVIRGLHFQKPPFSQAKLVRVLSGKVLDVAVDIRPNSPTFGKHVAVELSGRNKKQLYIPKGFAHGFAVLSKTAVFAYKCNDCYTPSHDSGIYFDDLNLGIDWMIPENLRVISKKDKNLSNLSKTVFLEK